MHSAIWNPRQQRQEGSAAHSNHTADALIGGPAGAYESGVCLEHDPWRTRAASKAPPHAKMNPNAERDVAEVAEPSGEPKKNLDGGEREQPPISGGGSGAEALVSQAEEEKCSEAEPEAQLHEPEKQSSGPAECGDTSAENANSEAAALEAAELESHQLEQEDSSELEPPKKAARVETNGEEVGLCALMQALRGCADPMLGTEALGALDAIHKRIEALQAPRTEALRAQARQVAARGEQLAQGVEGAFARGRGRVRAAVEAGLGDAEASRASAEGAVRAAGAEQRQRLTDEGGAMATSLLALSDRSIHTRLQVEGALGAAFATMKGEARRGLATSMMQGLREGEAAKAGMGPIFASLVVERIEGGVQSAAENGAEQLASGWSNQLQSIQAHLGDWQQKQMAAVDLRKLALEQAIGAAQNAVEGEEERLVRELGVAATRAASQMKEVGEVAHNELRRAENQSKSAVRQACDTSERLAVAQAEAQETLAGRAKDAAAQAIAGMVESSGEGEAPATPPAEINFSAILTQQAAELGQSMEVALIAETSFEPEGEWLQVSLQAEEAARTGHRRADLMAQEAQSRVLDVAQHFAELARGFGQTGINAMVGGVERALEQARAEVDEAVSALDEGRQRVQRLAETTPQSWKDQLESAKEQHLASAQAFYLRKYQHDWSRLWRVVEGLLSQLKDGGDCARVAELILSAQQDEANALAEQYARQGRGDLEQTISSKLKGHPRAAALAAFQGRRGKAISHLLKAATGIFNDDEARIETTLRQMSAADRSALLKFWASHQGRTHLRELRASLGGSDLAVFDALTAGNVDLADAIRIDEAIENGETNQVAALLERASARSEGEALDRLAWEYGYLNGMEPSQLSRQPLQSAIQELANPRSRTTNEASADGLAAMKSASVRGAVRRHVFGGAPALESGASLPIKERASAFVEGNTENANRFGLMAALAERSRGGAESLRAIAAFGAADPEARADVEKFTGMSYEELLDRKAHKLDANAKDKERWSEIGASGQFDTADEARLCMLSQNPGVRDSICGDIIGRGVAADSHRNPGELSLAEKYEQRSGNSLEADVKARQKKDVTSDAALALRGNAHDALEKSHRARVVGSDVLANPSKLVSASSAIGQTEIADELKSALAALDLAQTEFEMATQLTPAEERAACPQVRAAETKLDLRARTVQVLARTYDNVAERYTDNATTAVTIAGVAATAVVTAGASLAVTAAGSAAGAALTGAANIAVKEAGLGYAYDAIGKDGAQDALSTVVDTGIAAASGGLGHVVGSARSAQLARLATPGSAAGRWAGAAGVNAAAFGTEAAGQAALLETQAQIKESIAGVEPTHRNRGIGPATWGTALGIATTSHLPARTPKLAIGAASGAAYSPLPERLLGPPARPKGPNLETVDSSTTSTREPVSELK